jgi:hypothetical protein
MADPREAQNRGDRSQPGADRDRGGYRADR